MPLLHRSLRFWESARSETSSRARVVGVRQAKLGRTIEQKRDVTGAVVVVQSQEFHCDSVAVIQSMLCGWKRPGGGVTAEPSLDGTGMASE